MNSGHPPFDPPYVSIRHTDQGTAYIETLVDGTTRPLSSAEANWIQARESGAENAQSIQQLLSSKPPDKDSGRGRVFLKVPFAEKDQAKALGARWDATQKKWYVPSGGKIDLFAAWLPDALRE